MENKNIINILCFACVFIIMARMISSSEDLRGRILPAVLLVWSANSIVLIIKRSYIDKEGLENEK